MEQGGPVLTADRPADPLQAARLEAVPEVHRARPAGEMEPVGFMSADPAELPEASEVPETQGLEELETLPALAAFRPRLEAPLARVVRPIPVFRTLVRE